MKKETHNDKNLSCRRDWLLRRPRCTVCNLSKNTEAAARESGGTSCLTLLVERKCSSKVSNDNKVW